VMDQTSDGGRLKILVIFDEYSRESLRIVVGRSLKSHDVLDALDQLFELRGYPTYIRSDNGPEFIAGVIVDWLEMKGVDTLFIEP
jgi:putative transposase